MRPIARAREAGAGEINVDLIAGLPGEAMDRWGDTVARVAEEGPDHVSVYLLETDFRDEASMTVTTRPSALPPWLMAT